MHVVILACACRIWGEARTPATIKAAYLTHFQHATNQHLLGYWHFDALEAADKFHDFSSNGHDGIARDGGVQFLPSKAPVAGHAIEIDVTQGVEQLS